MRNYRKPLTKQGQKNLAEEHYQLAKVERPKVVDGIATAAAEGDRSENAEYIYGKKRLREIDRRIRYLNKVLKDAQIVDPDLLGGDQVTFACTVTVLNHEEQTKTWTLVGEGESDSNKGFIFWKSPVGMALMGKRVGDLVVVEVPAGEIELEVLGIDFTSSPWDR